MKHKTAELEGALLDAAVAKAEGLTLHGRWWRKPGRPDQDWCEVSYFNPSSRWQVGGPIIERELFEVSRFNGGVQAWIASYGYPESGLMSESGPTPLIAAMRAYVASKFGDEVELP